MGKKNISNNKGASTEASPTPGQKSSGVSSLNNQFVVTRRQSVYRTRSYTYQFKYFHKKLDGAYSEAKRLAEKEKATFLVLEVLGEVK